MLAFSGGLAKLARSVILGDLTIAKKAKNAPKQKSEFNVMGDSFNSAGKKNNAQPYDSRIDEKCEKCSGIVVYRKNSYFGNKVYYKVCNNCGWYRVIPKEEWKEIVAAALKPNRPTTAEEQAEQEEKVEVLIS